MNFEMDFSSNSTKSCIITCSTSEDTCSTSQLQSKIKYTNILAIDLVALILGL